MRSLFPALALVAVLAAADAAAQQRSRIFGTVVDANGEPVPNATVVATNPNNMPATLTKKTNKKGSFAFGGIQVGEWTLEVTADGFLPFEQRVHLGVGDNRRVEIVLERATGAALLATSEKAKKELDEAARRFEAGEYEAAIELYQALLAKAPEVYQIHFNLALAYERTGALEEAEEHYRLFLEKEPEHFEAIFGLANILARTGQPAEAIPLYETCARLRRDDPSVFFNLGLALFQSERLDEAAEAFDRALQIDPKLADAHFMLGNVRMRQGDPEGARAAYETYLELAPDGPNAAAAREAVERLAPPQDP